MKHDAAPVSDPPRLLGAGTDLERQLLRSARWDAAPAGARERIAAALGPALIDTPAPHGERDTGGAPREVATARVAPHEAAGHAALPPRALLFGLAGAGVAAFILAALLSRPASAPLAAASPGAQLAPMPDALPLVSSDAQLAGAAHPRVTEGAPALDLAPQRQRRTPSVKPAAAATSQRRAHSAIEAAEVKSAGTLLEEVQLLDTVRSALRAGNAARAATGLEQYAQRFPRGELEREASVLALDLLTATGQQQLARARARELLARPGMQRYAARVRAIAESSGVESTSGSGSDPGDAHIRGRR